jgi:ABC-type glutathione transport system ATPase component
VVAFKRIGAFLTAEELPDPYPIDFERKNAVDVDASFSWETAGKIEEPKFDAGAAGGGRGGMGGARGRGGGRGGGAGRGGGPKKKAKGKKGSELLPTANEKDTPSASGAATPREEEKPFELKNLRFSVPKGAFVAIVGKVGSGKVRWTLDRKSKMLIHACRAQFSKR